MGKVEDTIQWVLGFLFSLDGSQVLLIEKQRYNNHKGMLNGIGGVIGASLDETIQQESSMQAMHRKCAEETGLKDISWEHYANIITPTGDIACYRAFSDQINEARTMTEEELFIVNIETLRIMNAVDDVHILVTAGLKRHIAYLELCYQYVKKQL